MKEVVIVKGINMGPTCPDANRTPDIALPLTPWAKCIGCGCTSDDRCESPDTYDGHCKWIVVSFKFNIGVCRECEDHTGEFGEAYRASINARANRKGEIDGTDQRTDRDT